MRGSYGGFSIFWVIVVVAAPVVGVILNGGLPDGSNSTRGIPPIFIVGGGLGIAMLVGSKLLQERVRKQDAEGPKPTKIDEFAKSIGLLLEVDAATKRPKLTGRRGQVWLAVHLEKKKTRILARHNLSLPAGFSITNTGKKISKKIGASQGGVILGRSLQFAGTEGMPVVWEHPEIAGALMAVLHPFPGSSIDSQRIIIEGVGLKQDEIQGYIDEIVRLVEVLKAPPAQDIKAPRFPGT
ncbi:MAG: MFS family permease [Myxococcota bacterium]|jgi:MFS family permease